MLRSPNQRVVVQNMGIDRMIDLVSTDNWKSATIKRAQEILSSHLWSRRKYLAVLQRFYWHRDLFYPLLCVST